MDQIDISKLRQWPELTPAERYVYTLLLDMREEARWQVAMTQSGPLPDVQPDARYGPPGQVELSDVVRKLKAMAGLEAAPHKGTVEGRIDLNINGEPFVAVVCFDEQTVPAGCRITLAKASQ